MGPDAAQVSTITIAAGTPLVRADSHAFGSTEFDGRAGANARWSTIRVVGSVVPVIYAGEDDLTAASETIFRLGSSGRRPRFVFAEKYRTWQWSTVGARRDLTLADLRDPALQAVGVPRGPLLDGGEHTYPHTRRWAEQLLAAARELDGMVWHARQTPTNRLAYVLFESPAGGVVRNDLDAVGSAVPFTSIEGIERLRQIAVDYDVTLIEP